MKILSIYIILVLLFSCSPEETKLEKALQLAGNNRPELEKILHHYSRTASDSLKLKAAEFLIENMPGHYTLADKFVQEYRRQIHEDSTASYYAKKTFDILLGVILNIDNSTIKKEDIQHISADFLISHIDASFKLLQNYSWLEDIPFDIFLDYLLPYRLENEEPDLWRDSLFVPQQILDLVAHNDEIKYSFAVKRSLKLPRTQTKLTNSFISKILGTNYTSRDCSNLARREVFESRVLGIPCALDYVPAYANRNGEHYWSTLVGEEELKIQQHRKVPKIYRYTFSHNPVAKPNREEYIPELFQNPFIKDVTDQFLQTVNLVIPIKNTPNRRKNHVYLCVFNNLEWQPISIGKQKNGKARFQNIGKNILYLPTYYRSKRIASLNYPFILDKRGNVKYLIPDTLEQQSIRLYRKYPFKSELVEFHKIFPHIVIDACQDRSFLDTAFITQLDSSNIHYASKKIHTQERFRFWRLSMISPRQTPQFAELIFFDPEGQVLKGRVESKFQEGFDDNPLTNVTMDKSMEIIIDFGEPVEVARVICLPRGDGNGIYSGNEYELYYHDLNGWCSLGRKTASDCYIEYDNIPSGALLWLRNLTSGMEERAFTLENGEIRFW